MYEYDKSTGSDSLINQAFRKPKDEVFKDHKTSILFYLGNGNPKRLGLLKELAKSEIAFFARTSKYAEYEKLREQIAGRE